MSHNIEIKDGAIFISDAHYSPSRPELLDFFKDIKNKKINPFQIVLMGDIFDALFGSIKRTYITNQELIDIINDLSIHIDIIYLEGNHDFHLKNIFPNVKVFTISNQPLACKINDKKVYLAHGDFDINNGYKIYTAIARNRVILFILNILNTLFGNFILNALNKHLSKKDDFAKINNFQSIIKNKLENKFECDYFIEGHYHQNKSFKLNDLYYINLDAFACNQRYFIVDFAKDEFIKSEKYLKRGKLKND